MDARASIRRILLAKALRAFGDGYVALLLPVYLLDLGFSALEVGAIATATLVGSGVLTLVVGLRAHRHSYRALLIAATVLMAGTGAGFAVVRDFWPLLAIAIVGTLNPSSGDVSVFLPLEHAVLSGVVDDRARTSVFAPMRCRNAWDCRRPNGKRDDCSCSAAGITSAVLGSLHII